ncbi:MAG: Epoxyqueuosine reductase [Chlamydiae bacterium]|nr:Epoxyqueuosine reductase [Chlamydiota bacterium]
MPKDLLPEEIFQQAFALGYDDVGITTATIPEEDVEAYRRWILENHHGELGYMENDMRCHPEQLFPGAKTAIIFVSHYKQEKQNFDPQKGVIASYARGRDYHNVHRKRLKKIIHWMEERTGQINIARGFSDSAPIMERALAVQAGLGWFGKNTLLIHRKFGTFTLLSGLLTTLEIPGKVTKERMPRCGSCTRCLDACPTQALSPFKLDATKCLSYHLIESKKEIPKDIGEKNPGYIFGCDICQDVCPHNVRPPQSQAPDFSPSRGIGSILDLSQLEEIENHPEELFGTPLQRRGVQGLKHTMKKILEKDVMIPENEK